jgi:hypothetical protein
MKNARWLLIILCFLFAISSLVSGVFAESLQRALVLPPDHPMATISAGATPATRLPTPTAMTLQILAQDTFQRPDQALWGRASDGQNWEGDANAQAQSFFIARSQGVMMHAKGTFNAILGPVSSNVEVTATGSVSRFGAGQVNFGVVVRWTDSKNWYKVLINGTQFVVLKRVKGITSQLSAQPFTAQGNTLYTLRLQAIGAVLLAKVWPSATMEPVGWMVNVTDTSLTTGQGGVRVLVQNDVIVHLAAFSESLARSQV